MTRAREFVWDVTHCRPWRCDDPTVEILDAVKLICIPCIHSVEGLIHRMLGCGALFILSTIDSENHGCEVGGWTSSRYD